MSRPSRLSRHSYIGRSVYFLTFCTYKRIKAFVDADVVARTLEQFRRTSAIEQFAILAYCVMPDHVHLLVRGLTTTSNLKRFAKMAKQRSGGTHRRRCGVRLWQEGYFERLLRDEDEAGAIAQYLRENPIRAGLGEDYPHVSDRVGRVLLFGPAV